MNSPATPSARRTRLPAFCARFARRRTGRSRRGARLRGTGDYRRMLAWPGLSRARRGQGHGLHLIIGGEINLRLPAATVRKTGAAGDRSCRLRHLSNSSRWRARVPIKQLSRVRIDLEGRAPGHPHLQNLPGCLTLLIPSSDASFEQFVRPAMWLKTCFPNVPGSRWKSSAPHRWSADRTH